MFRKITDTVFASPQIGLGEVAEAAAQGIRLIVNNRPEGESDDQVPGTAIEAAARAAGLGYVAIPVTHAGFSEGQVSAMREALDGFRLVAPHVEYRQRMQLTLGGRTLELLHLRNVHSEADTAVWLPNERVLFSAADSAFAFACNSHGILTLALDVSISFTRPARIGDLLHVEAREIHLGNRTGVYEVRITNAAEELVALFKGTAYRTSKPVI